VKPYHSSIVWDWVSQSELDDIYLFYNTSFTIFKRDKKIGVKEIFFLLFNMLTEGTGE